MLEQGRLRGTTKIAQNYNVPPFLGPFPEIMFFLSSPDIEMPIGFWYLGQDGLTLCLNKPRPFGGLETSEEMLPKVGRYGDDLKNQRRRRKYLLKRHSPASGNDKILPFPRLGK